MEQGGSPGLCLPPTAHQLSAPEFPLGCPSCVGSPPRPPLPHPLPLLAFHMCCSPQNLLHPQLHSHVCFQHVNLSITLGVAANSSEPDPPAPGIHSKCLWKQEPPSRCNGIDGANQSRPSGDGSEGSPRWGGVGGGHTPDTAPCLQ